MYMFIFYFLGLFFLSANPTSLQETSKLEVKISNVRNSDGYVLVTLFNNERGFPDRTKYAVRNEKIKAEVHTTVVFEEIPYGTYAIAVLHDENGNGVLDKNVVGIPIEGYGSSNNQKKLFRAPNFDECKFSVDKETTEIDISLNY